VNKDIRILVVEDSALQRELCIFQLKELGFGNITGKENGAEALSWLEENSVDLIISDWEMPELNGLEFLKKIRENPSLQKIPFFMLTILKDDSKNAEAIEAGVTDFLVKPTPADILQEKMEKFFGDS